MLEYIGIEGDSIWWGGKGVSWRETDVAGFCRSVRALTGLKGLTLRGEVAL
jgi:hypothetical protein